MKSYIYSSLIILFIAVGAYLNIAQEKAVDQSKIPSNVEESIGFQRWITNLRNKGFETNADEFRLLEENEIYNTKWLKIESLDAKGVEEQYKTMMENSQETEKIVYSPNKRQFVDYRFQERNGYEPNEVHFYGLREDKVLDARILDCSLDSNCYFDRAYFLEDSNDIFVVSEFSRNIGEYEENVEPCSITEVCTYSIKLHVINLLRNSRLVYESKPFEINLSDVKKDL